MASKDNKDALIPEQYQDVSHRSASEEPEMIMEEARDEVKEVKKMAKKETARVNIMRAVIVVLLVAAFVVTFVTYRLLQQEQQKSFEAAFSQFSRTLAEAAMRHRVDVTEAFNNHIETISAGAQGHTDGNAFPYYSPPFYERSAQNLLDQGKVEAAAICVRVKDQNYSDWIAYANETYDEWVHDAHMFQYGSLDSLDPVGYRPFITKVEPGVGLVESPPGDKDEYWVHWNSYPSPATYLLINWDLASVGEVYQNIIAATEILKTETLVTHVRSYSALIGTAFTKEFHDSLHDELPEGESEFPHSMHFQAILEDLNDPESEVVAVLAAGVAWDRAMQDLLPEGVSDIIAVVENNCNQSFTFTIDGPKANFIGTGDHHDPKWNYMQVNVDLNAIKDPRAAEVPGHCVYWMNLYPSEEFRAAYDTNTPEVFAVVVACTFVMIAVAIFVYHMLVERRNTKLVQTTARSNTIMTRLFPSNVRDKLLEEEQLKDSSSTHGRLASFLVGGTSSENLDLDNSNKSRPNKGNIIAENFEECTIMFADMAGFTKFSANKDPQDIFLLLETVYGGFDEIARRRGIFKVETIGDCYVAVAGVPQKRKDHAVLMAKFSHDIMNRMALETKKLEATLGEGTNELTLRIGLHSGPITAGVLRGDRARFQLFGTTMNQASRMESTGVPGRVQLSEETASLLRSAKRDAWLTQREDAVEAKGLGRLTTYFLNFSQTDKETMTTSTGSADGGGISDEPRDQYFDT